MLTKSDFETIRRIVREEVKEEVKEQLDEAKTELKSQNATSQDVIIGRLDTIDQKLEVSSGYKDQLEDHDSRLTKLEEIHPQGKHIKLVTA